MKVRLSDEEREKSFWTRVRWSREERKECTRSDSVRLHGRGGMGVGGV